MFLNQATQVNAWDRLLMDNGEKIVKLHESVEKVKLDQQVSTFSSIPKKTFESSFLLLSSSCNINVFPPLS